MKDKKLEVGVDLTAVVGAFVYDAKSAKSGVVKKLIAIPTDNLYTDRQGRVWLTLTAYPNAKDNRTHYLKQKVSKAVFASLPTDEQGRKNTPFAGNIRLAEEIQQAQPVQSPASAFVANTDDDGDLPF